MHSKNNELNLLLVKYQKISLLNKIIAILDWDTNVNLPPNASEGRARQIALLTEELADLWLDKEFKSAFEKAKESKKLTEVETAIIRNLDRAAKYYFKVPKEIIVEKAQTTSEAFMIWQKAKQENKFKDFLPILKRIIKLNQIIADHLGYRKNRYDALLDLYEPELVAETASKIFTTLQPKLTQLLKKIQKSKGYFETSPLIEAEPTYPQQDQKQLLSFIIKKMNYDLDSGRIDTSSHPFETVLDRHDIRITTRYNLKDFRESFYSAMHEAGHALYEQGINPDYSETPLENGTSYAIHESQSRFWENQIGRNPNFIEYIAPLFQAFYPEQLKDSGAPTLIKLFNQVRPGFIRTEADEVTYNLHIILRFELENDLLNNKLDPADLPQIWNIKMKKYLGVTPPSDSKGVLQDVHWSYGYFGYFPTYCLGNLYAAQITASIKKEIDIDKILKSGELGTILSWLKEHIHQHGSLYLPQKLITDISGEQLNPDFFIEYLNQKYSQIYDF